MVGHHGGGFGGGHHGGGFGGGHHRGGGFGGAHHHGGGGFGGRHGYGGHHHGGGSHRSGGHHGGGGHRGGGHHGGGGHRGGGHHGGGHHGRNHHHGHSRTHHNDNHHRHGAYHHVHHRHGNTVIVHDRVTVVGGFYGPFYATPFFYRPYWATPYWYVPWYYPPWYYRPPPPWWAPPPPVVRPGVVVVGDAVPGAVEATGASEIYPLMVLDVGRCQLMRRLRPVEERNDGVYADTAVLDETNADGAAVKRAVSFRAWEGPLLWDARHKDPEKLWLGRRPDDMRSLAATIVTFHPHDASSWNAAQRWAERARDLLGSEQVGATPCGTVALVGVTRAGAARVVGVEEAAVWAAERGFLLFELPEAEQGMGDVMHSLATALLATARQQREKLREQEAALKQLQEALEPPGLFAKVDADALWRAIDAARHAGCREEALQVAEKKLADITTPSWWQRAVEPAPVESSGAQGGGDTPVASEASGAGGAVVAAPAGAVESDGWYPGKYVGKAWNSVFGKD